MKTIIAAFATALTLSACGGGGGNSPATNPPPVVVAAGKPVLIEAYGDGATLGCTPTAGASAGACPAGYAIASTTVTQAVQADLRATLGSSVTVSNKGIFGTTADALLNGTLSGLTWDAAMQASQAQIVTINVGLSDVSAIENFSTDLISLVQTAKAHGKTVVLITPNPIIGPNPAVLTPDGQAIINLRAQITSVASSMQVALADEYEAASIGEWIPLLPDGRYPSSAGYQTKADAVESQILAPIVRPML